MANGFVYLLGNRAMPIFYKIGCTERDPRHRAAELSGTAAPYPFEVLLYIEAIDHQRAEQRLHRELSDFRVRQDREFFCFGPGHMAWLREVFRRCPDAIAFEECEWQRHASGGDVAIETWSADGSYLRMPHCPPIEPGDLRYFVEGHE